LKWRLLYHWNAEFWGSVEENEGPLQPLPIFTQNGERLKVKMDFRALA
jgi:hypothetical protein